MPIIILLKAIRKKKTDRAEINAVSSGINLALNEYGIENFDLVYDDQQANIRARIKDLDYNGKGDLSWDIVNLSSPNSFLLQN